MCYRRNRNRKIKSMTKAAKQRENGFRGSKGFWIMIMGYYLNILPKI
jgi:hypothetical protein